MIDYNFNDESINKIEENGSIGHANETNHNQGSSKNDTLMFNLTH